MKTKEVRGNDIQRRLIKFAARIIKLCDTLSAESIASSHIARQLMRSGTSPAPNYGEARGAESTADFIHNRTYADPLETWTTFPKIGH